VKRFEALNGAAGVMLLATVGFLMVHSAQQDDSRTKDQAQIQTNGQKADDASAKAVQAQTDAGKAIRAVEEANRRLKAAGKPQVPVPTLAPASPADAPSGLTAEQIAVIRSIVLGELATQSLNLSASDRDQLVKTVVALVPKPKDGVSPTDAQIQARVDAAVAARCADDKCRGRDGTGGTDGQPGPGPTDEQLLAASKQALETYCAQESKPCDGKDGQPGGEGSPGQAGKDAEPAYSVDDMDCVGDDTASVWRIYLSNGTDQKTFDRPGPCRIGPDPN
jgi:hypothetical protein